MKTNQNPSTEISVPRVVTVAAQCYRTWPKASRNAIVRCNMRSAVNAANFNSRLPNLRQVLGY